MSLALRNLLFTVVVPGTGSRNSTRREHLIPFDRRREQSSRLHAIIISGGSLLAGQRAKPQRGR